MCGGVPSSPYVSTRCIHEIAKQNRTKASPVDVGALKDDPCVGDSFGHPGALGVHDVAGVCDELVHAREDKFFYDINEFYDVI